MTSEAVADLVASFETELEAIPKEKAVVEQFLAEKLLKTFHPNHSVIMDAKFILVQLYGRNRLKDEAVMIREGRRKQELCRQILDVMSLVLPGKVRLRGMFLCELYVVSMYLLRQELESKTKTLSAIKADKLKALRPLLTESIEILSWEPRESIEGDRCRLARDYLFTLDANIEKAEKEKTKTK